MQVVFFQNGWDADYVEAGGPGSPNWHKSNALKTMREKPELHGKLLAKGGWDYELVEALPPQPGDIVVAQAALQRLLQHRPRQHAARARHPQLWSSPASPPTSASSRPCATASSWNISASCWRTPRTMPGPPSSRRRRSTTSRTSSAGCPSVEEFRAALAGQHQPDADQGRRPDAHESHLPSAAPASRSRPTRPAPWPTAWSMSRARWRSTRTPTSSMSATPPRRPGTCWRPSSR